MLPTSVFLRLRTSPNLVISGGTGNSEPRPVGNPNIDPGYAGTWSITYTYPGNYNSGTIAIELNGDNTVRSFSLRVRPDDEPDQGKWYGFTATSGFSNDGAAEEISVTNPSWETGPNGAPSREPYVVSTIGGAPAVTSAGKRGGDRAE